MSPAACRLYLITPPELPAGFARTLAEALDAGDVAAVQLRLKGVEDRAILRAAEPLADVCRERNVAFLINDRPDLAHTADADGVHIGQQDASYAEARRILGPDRMIGVSCHNSRDLGLTAAELGADYVAFGAFFATTTKTPPAMADVELLEWWHELIEVPCVAIGGITVQNCGTVARAGADFVAVMSGVWSYPAGPAAAVRDFNDAIRHALPPRVPAR